MSEIAETAVAQAVVAEPDLLLSEIGPRTQVRRRVLEAVDVLGADGIFHEYQKEAIALSHEHDLLVVEKGRRTGLTWAFAGDDVVTAATRTSEGGDDVFYIGPSFDMALEYIEACAGFAKAFMGIDALVNEEMFEDEILDQPGKTRKITSYKIEFASGHKIQALTSAPSSIRGRQGLIRIDEGAFHKDLERVLAAGLPLTILGARVVIISTHDGVDNPFNKLIQEIRSGEQAGHVVTIPFSLAVEQGIYERVATIKGWDLTQEAKDKWVAKVRKNLGKRGDQELECIPSKSAGKWLAFDLIERAEEPGAPIIRLAYDDAFAFRPDEERLADITAWCERELAPWLETLDGSPHGVGGDFARFSDLSVIWILQELEDRSWRTPFVVEMRNVPFTEQLFVWVFILKRIRRWRAKVDAHGNGAFLAERLQQLFGVALVEAVKALMAWWAAQGPPLHQRFVDGRILIPQHRDIATDLRMVEMINGAPRVPEVRTKETSDEGESTEGKRHGDDAVALFHASAALREGADVEVGGATAGQTGAPAAFLGGEASPYEPLNLHGY
jgi:phage FluMu gp28-like protein